MSLEINVDVLKLGWKVGFHEKRYLNVTFYVVIAIAANCIMVSASNGPGFSQFTFGPEPDAESSTCAS